MVFWATLKNALLPMDPGVASSASMRANSPIQVVPTIARSGVLLALIALVNLSCAESHGMAVTVILVPGLSASNFLASWPSSSPLVPIAQTVRLPVAFPAASEDPVRRTGRGRAGLGAAARGDRCGGKREGDEHGGRAAVGALHGISLQGSRPGQGG